MIHPTPRQARLHPGARWVLRLALAAGLWLPHALAQVSDEIVIATSGALATVTTLDPLFDSNTGEVVFNLFDPLVRIDRLMVDGRPQFQVTDRGVAESWRAVSDHIWELEIRQGILFHDGTPLTANDVAFSVNQILDPAFSSRLAAVLPGIANAEALNDRTLWVFTDRPIAEALLMLARVMIVPQAYYTEVGPQAFSERPIGSGPYRFETWVRGDYVALRAFDDYWQGRPDFDRAVFRNVTESASRVVAIRSGQAHIVNNIPPVLFADLANDQSVQTIVHEGNQHVLFGLDGRSGPFADTRVRQAVMHAIDRQEIVEVLYDTAFARPVTGLIMQGLPGYDPALEDLFPYDPERARSLLAEAGYAQGFTTELLYSPGVLAQVDELVQAYIGYLADVGITVQLQAAESGGRLEMIRDGRVPGIFSTSCGNQTGNPAHCFNLWVQRSGAGRGWYWPEMRDYDAELASLVAEFDDEVRAARFAEMNAYIAQEAPFIWGHHENSGWAIAPTIEFLPTWQGYTDLRNARLR